MLGPKAVPILETVHAGSEMIIIALHTSADNLSPTPNRLLSRYVDLLHTTRDTQSGRVVTSACVLDDIFHPN
jgi:hypothetical protein